MYGEQEDETNAGLTDNLIDDSNYGAPHTAATQSITGEDTGNGVRRHMRGWKLDHRQLL